MAGRSQRAPTVREVAQRAGVSPMTVSRTLAGGANVRPDVQQRVFEAVRELGYTRNENARSIRPGQASGLIGVAITNIANPYYGNFALGVEEVASQTGRRIVLGNTGEDPARERQLVADFIGRQVEGLVVVPTAGEGEHLRPERLGDTPVVLASRRVPGLDADAVLVDDIGGAEEGTRALIEDGHERIAFLGTARSVFTGQRRYQGYASALRESGLEPDDALVRRDQQDVDAAGRAMKELLDAADPPTAVFSANNRNTIGAVREIGRRLREGTPAADLPALVSFDDFELAELMPFPVTIIAHDARELGRQAASLLIARLAEGAGGMPSRLIEMPVSVAPATHQ